MKNDFRDRESENCFSDFSGKIEFYGYAFWVYSYCIQDLETVRVKGGFCTSPLTWSLRQPKHLQLKRN